MHDMVEKLMGDNDIRSTAPATGSEPALDSIHEEWRNAWGVTIHSEAARRIIGANERLSGRIGKSIIENLNIAKQDLHLLGDRDRRAYKALISAPEKFCQRIGLVWYADLIAAQVTRDSYTRTIPLFDPEDVAAALKLRHLSPEGEHAGFSPDRFRELVLASGQRCVTAWAEECPAGTRARVFLTLPRHFAAGSNMPEERRSEATKIVRAVAEQFEGAK